MKRSRIYRVISAISILFFSLATLGKTGSYTEAIFIAWGLYGIQVLGHESNHAATLNESLKVAANNAVKAMSPVSVFGRHDSRDSEVRDIQEAIKELNIALEKSNET